MAESVGAHIAARDGEGAAVRMIEAVAAEGLRADALSRALLKAATPSLDLRASLPFPERGLDILFSIDRVARRLSPRGVALALAQGAHWVATSPQPRRPLPEAIPPKMPPEDAVDAFAGAISRGDLPLARGLMRQVLAEDKWPPALGRGLVSATSEDAFQGGERLLSSIAAWLLIRRSSAEDAAALLDPLLPYLCAEPQDRAPARAFDALREGAPLPPLEPEGFEAAWAVSLIKGVAQSQLPRSLPRLLRPGLLKTLTGRMTLPPVAPEAHLRYADALVARSAANLPEALRPLHEALREGDRARALPMAAEVVGDGRGYGRVLRLAAMVGAERMMVRRYKGGFGMAQDIRLCNGAALLADFLGAKDAIPAVWLTAYVVGRGAASLGGPVPKPSRGLATGVPERDREAWVSQLAGGIAQGDLDMGREALGALMSGTTPISHVNRALLEAAVETWDPEGIAFPFTVACVGVAEHMPRLDAELVLAAALSFLTTRPPTHPPPWVTEALTRAGL